MPVFIDNFCNCTVRTVEIGRGCTFPVSLYGTQVPLILYFLCTNFGVGMTPHKPLTPIQA